MSGWLKLRAKAVADARGERPSSTLGRRTRVLVVDPAPGVAANVQGVLEAEGWEVIRAATGAEALERARLEGCDAIVAGMGGGTGTGAAPVVAEVAKKLDAVTFAIAINPFSYEGGRQEVAKEGIKKLKRQVESTIVLENDRLLNIAGDSSVSESFAIIERSINSLIGSLTARISKDLQEQIRQEVVDALPELDTIELVKPVPAPPMAELISAKSLPTAVEMPFASSITPELLSR